ncbi:MAG TPA: VOC family protein [Vicinamibacterales bacterium]|nr:VOC family protein [Vicinamibacterales bacterium]
MGRRTAVRALGEVALRVNNLAQMKRFYQDVLGLEVLGEFSQAALLTVADGYGGHTQVLGLFDRSVPVGPEHTTVDHFAFTIALEDYESEKRRLEALGLDVEVTNHDWVKWRSLYFRDPEGNLVELVCYDETLGQ